MEYYGDPPEDFCPRCEALGLDECNCPFDPNDPLEQPWVDDNDGLTKEQYDWVTHDVRQSIVHEEMVSELTSFLDAHVENDGTFDFAEIAEWIMAHPQYSQNVFHFINSSNGQSELEFLGTICDAIVEYEKEHA